MSKYAEVYKIRITRRNGVEAWYPDGNWSTQESAEAYMRRYVPSYQQPRVSKTFKVA